MNRCSNFGLKTSVRIFFIFAFVGLALSGLAAQAQTVFDLSNDFSTGGNPNKVWQYGYSASNSLAIDQFRLDKSTDSSDIIRFWHSAADSGPDEGYYPYIANKSSKRSQVGCKRLLGKYDSDAETAGSRETGVRMAKQLRHVVCFKFRDGVAADDREKVEMEFCALQKKIPGIVELEWGTNSSPEKLNKGLTHCFILTFASDKDRDQYLVHPAHLEFVKLIKQFTDDAMVLDFWQMNSNP